MIAVWMLIGGVAAPAALPDFTFRDWHAHAGYIDGDVRLQQCKAVPYGKQCFLSDSRIGGVEASHIGVAFGPKGLIVLEARLRTGDASTVEAALRQRYGEPCQKKVYGVVWCFRDGRVTFEPGTPFSDALFQFKTHDAAKQMAVVDF